MGKELEIRSLGNKEDFEALFREYFKALVFYSIKIVGDHDSAKEIVHTVFISLWEKRFEIRTDKPLKPYLYTAVHNRSLNYLRDRSKFYTEDISEMTGNDILADEVKDNIAEAETELAVSRAMEKLPPKCREVFVLNRLNGMKYREIALELGISVKTVENQISKALRIMRDELKDYLTVLILFMLYYLFKNL